jgi:hypothetical protein
VAALVLTPVEEDDLLPQSLTLCEEDRRRLFPENPWAGGYRWFRSTNVVDLQKYRSPTEKERIRAVLLYRARQSTTSPIHYLTPI